MDREEVLRGLKQAHGIITGAQTATVIDTVAAINAAMAMLRVSDVEEIEAARKQLDLSQGASCAPNSPAWRTLNRALDALARESATTMTDEDVMVSQCKAIAALEADNALLRRERNALLAAAKNVSDLPLGWRVEDSGAFVKTYPWQRLLKVIDDLRAAVAAAEREGKKP